MKPENIKSMKFAVVASKQDIAGMNIASFIQGLPKHFTGTNIIHAESIDKKDQGFSNPIREDFIIFASKHRGAQEKILSLHALGNWKKAEFGGKAGKVCKTSAVVLKTFFQELNKNIPEGWHATLECTHHGPHIEKPCLFIEVGSNEENWKDKEAAKAVAKTIENAIKILQNNIKYKPAVAIGGPHYCPNFNKIQLNSEYTISHIIPEYALPLTEEMLKEAIRKTIEPVEIVLLDWKGLGKSEERKKVIDLLSRLNLKYKRTNEVEKQKVLYLRASSGHKI